MDQIRITKIFGINNITIKSKSEAYRNFFHIAWPAAAEGFLINLLSSVDLAMAGTLGTDAQAAIGIISQPKMMILLIARALAVAVTAVVARRYGEGKLKEMTSILKQSLTLTSGIYFILLSISILLFSNILVISGAKPAYFQMAKYYGQIIFVGLFFNSITMIINGALVAVGNTKIIFISNLAGNVLNVILNYGFIFGKLGLPKLGIIGVGIGTLCGNILTLIIVLLVLQRESSILRLDSLNWKPQLKILNSVFYVSKGTIPEQIFERIGMYLYTIMVANLGAIHLAVHHICMNLCDIFYSVAMGLGTATSSTTGQMLGRKDPNAAKIYAKIGQLTGLVVSVLGFSIFAIFKYQIMRIFTKNPTAIEMGAKILIIVAIASFPQTFSLVNSGVLKGAGDTKYVAKYSLIIIAIIRPIVTYILLMVLKVGLFGAWIALLMDQSLRAIAATLRYKSGIWTKINI